MIEHGRLCHEDLKKALAQQRREGGLLGSVLVSGGLIDQDILLAFLARLNEASAVSLGDYNINEQAIQQVPADLCEKRCILPIDKLGRILTVAMVDPLDTEALEEVQRHCPDLRVKPLQCRWDDFEDVFHRIYKKRLTKPEGLEQRYAHLDGLQLSVQDGDASGKESAVAGEVPEFVPEEFQEMEGSEPAEVFETPDIDMDEIGVSSRSTFSTDRGSQAVILSSNDIATGVQELAVAVRESIRETMTELAATVAGSGYKEQDRATAELMLEAMQEALEGAVAVLADELRLERETLASQLETAGARQSAGPSAADIIEAAGDSFNHTVDRMLEALSAQLQQMGAALQEQGSARSQEPPLPELVEALQSAVAQSSRESAATITAALQHAVATGEHEGFDPKALAEVVRDGIGDVVGKALENLSSNIQNLADAQREHIAALPPPPDLQSAAVMLQEQLTAGLDRRLSVLAEQLQSIMENNSATSGKQIETLAGTLRESVLSAIAANEKAQAEQQNRLASILETSFGALYADKDAQQSSLSSIADAILAAVEAGRIAQSEQQSQLTRIVEASFASLAANKAEEQGGLGRVADAIVHAIETSQTRQAEQQAQLIKLVESNLAAITVDKGGQQGDLAGFAEAILRAIESDKSTQSEKQAQLAQIAQAALESVKQTSQLIEAHTVAENTRNDLLRRRQSKHASVTAFNPEGTVNPEDYEEEDRRVREGLDSERPVNKLTFDTFFPGEANVFAVNLAKSVAATPGGEYNPLFLYGAVGLGKTHLISAIGNAILRRTGQSKAKSHARVGYISASHFSRRLAAAIADDSLELFRDNYCNWDVLLLDDIQFLGGRIEAQEEFFHIFNVLLQAGRQLVIAGDKPPDKLGLLEQRLVSRFSSGIVVEIKAPEWETRMKILRQTAQDAKSDISNEILSLVALSVSDDIRKMIGALRKIIAYSHLQQSQISMEDAQNILSHVNTAELM